MVHYVERTLTEVYYPTVDRPQLRDLEYLITDGKSFFHEEKRHLKSTMARISHHALGYDVENSDPEGRYSIQKQVIADPHLPCVLQRTSIRYDNAIHPNLQMYVLCAPHLDGGGKENNGYVVRLGGREILAAERNGFWLALGATIPFSRTSCGYVGYSDGWTDLCRDMQMDWEFDRALNGNIALTGQLDISESKEFSLGLALGDSLHNAISTLLQSLQPSFDSQLKLSVEQWERPFRKILPLENVSTDQGNLYHGSYSLLLAHEDKTYPGAFIASLSIPWGEAKGDEDKGGYHLVWTRDMVNTATALLAAGNTETPIRALIYLATVQQEDGGFAQNFWINGERYWGGVQLDEVAFPIILAWRLKEAGALGSFDPYSMVIRAASYLIRHGPATQQECWEEASGYSPSTLASNIAALICAADFARERGDKATANYLEEYADFLECHIEAWTVTTEGTLMPSIKRHYIRILPVNINDHSPLEDPNQGILTLANQPSSANNSYPAKEIVDAGFLELVSYGIKRPDDPIVVDSLCVVDQVLKVETPRGSCWHRYNHDGYGQREDGGPYEGWGKGRAWPLLTGERGMYEIAAGNSGKQFIETMEKFATRTGLLPEQVWDEEDKKDLHLHFGNPTGSAMPLVWAHAQYIKLLRSSSEKKVFDKIPAVANRYINNRSKCKDIEIWKFNRQPRSVKRGFTMRIQAASSFCLHWTRNEWKEVEETESTPTALGIEFVDISVPLTPRNTIQFTFYWTREDRWEGRNFVVPVA